MNLSVLLVDWLKEKGRAHDSAAHDHEIGVGRLIRKGFKRPMCWPLFIWVVENESKIHLRSSSCTYDTVLDACDPDFFAKLEKTIERRINDVRNYL